MHIKKNITSVLIGFSIFLFNVSTAFSVECGKAIKPLSFYNDISLYALIVMFILVFNGILTDKKKIKNVSFLSALIPFFIWGYIHFIVDFSDLKKNVYAYNALAEGTLANIAEAQDRYKSEQDVFLKDLQQLYSHIAGSHGINPCVQIISINAGFAYWIAEAKHVSSPDTIKWDSNSGSSLKKG